MAKTRAPTILAVAAVAALTACSGDLSRHGHLVRTTTIAELEPGVQTKDGILRLLGSPSSTGPFDDSTWYYISEQSRSVAFLRPHAVDRQVLVVRFDDQGILDEVGTLRGEDGREVVLVSRQTPTAGHELTLVEQLVGNIGRFNRPAR
jgi:outer membrane protein assembly factor BamE (lipoprotein component of BamABCDE complex)